MHQDSYTTELLLQALREALQNLEAVRMTDPQDISLPQLKEAIRNKIAEIEAAEQGSMAGD